MAVLTHTRALVEAGGGCALEGDRQLVGVLAFLEAPHLPVRPVQQVYAGRAVAARPCVARLRGSPATLAWSGSWSLSHTRSLAGA